MNFQWEQESSVSSESGNDTMSERSRVESPINEGHLLLPEIETNFMDAKLLEKNLHEIELYRTHANFR